MPSFDDEKAEISTDKKVIDQAIKEGIVSVDQQHTINQYSGFFEIILKNEKLKLLIKERYLTVKQAIELGFIDINRHDLRVQLAIFEGLFVPVMKQFMEYRKKGLLKLFQINQEDFIVALIEKYRNLLSYSPVPMYYGDEVTEYIKTHAFRPSDINAIIQQHEHMPKKFEALKKIADFYILGKKIEKNEQANCYLQSLGRLSSSYIKEFFIYFRNMAQSDKEEFFKKIPPAWALLDKVSLKVDIPKELIDKNGKVPFYKLDDVSFNEFIENSLYCELLINRLRDQYQKENIDKELTLKNFKIDKTLQDNLYSSLKKGHQSNDDVIRKYQTLSSIINQLRKYKDDLIKSKAESQVDGTDKKIKATEKAIKIIGNNSEKSDILESLHSYLKDEFVTMQEHRGKVGKFFSGLAKTHGHEVVDEIMKIAKEHEDARREPEEMKRYSK